MAQLARRGGFLGVAARAGLLAAALAACQSQSLQPAGGAGGKGGTTGHPVPDSGGGGASTLGGDAGVDRPSEATVAPLGAVCTESATCASGFCVEGVCCASACTGGCQTCSAPGAVGTCLARATAARPRQAADCPPSSPATCGLDGTCDGAGACRLYLGTTCLSGLCANGVVTGGGVCDGQGDCRPGPTIICAPYACDSATNLCLTACQSDGQCAAGLHCQSGSCAGDSGLGACSRNEQCFSGNCAGGVCCNTPCKGPCVSCAITGRVGTCSPVSKGTLDPHAVCLDQGAASCGHDGTCDGQGGCTLYAAGVTCAATSSCSGTLWSGPGTCDGEGTCQRETRPCLPYACDSQTNACHNACTNADDCAPGKPCVNGTCGIREQAACSVDAECATGFCAQGTCCTTKCDGPCSSCALPGTIGTCTPVPYPPDAGACAS